MTITAVAAQLLTYFSPEERGIPNSGTYPGRNEAVALAMNLALQELYGEGSPWVRYDERGSILHAPTAITISVTNGSTAATVTGWQSWMAGCSVVISGSGYDNKFRNDDASAVLKIPYDGTTGSKSATVYHDAISMAPDVLEVLEPIRVNMKPLTPLVSGASITARPSDQDYGFHRHSPSNPPPARVADAAGQPLGFAVETWSKNATSSPLPRLLIQPAPLEAGMIEFRARLVPPVVVGDLTSSALLPIPFQFIQSLFFPIARFHLSASAFYRSIDGEGAAQAAYQQAVRMLKDLNPTPASGTRWVGPY